MKAHIRYGLCPALLALTPLAAADGSLLDQKTLTGAHPLLTLEDGDEFGTAITRIGDLDGNGVDDFAVGAPGDDDAGIDEGAVYVVFVEPDGSVGSIAKITPAIPHALGLTGFGRAVARVGDVDADGIGDLAVGRREGVDILFMNTDGTVASTQIVADGVGIVSVPASRFGDAVCSMGDIDADGTPDIAVGAPNDNDGGSQRGALYVFRLFPNGTVKSQRKISSTQSGFTGALDNFDHFGAALARVGDLDQNGLADLAVGAPQDDDGGGSAGAVWILFRNPNGTVLTQTKISDLAGGFGGNLSTSDSFGSSIARMGDLDGDGVNDIAVGAFGDSDGGLTSGAFYVCFLNSNGTVESEIEYSATEGGVTGLQAGDRFGRSVSRLADVDGDGLDEILVGAYNAGPGFDTEGAAHLLAPIGYVPASSAPAGCDLNPAGSLVVSVPPVIGATSSFLVDNPIGSQNPGSLPFLAVTVGAILPCGAPIPGWNMDPALANGELVVLPVDPLIPGAAWSGPGNPVQIDVAVPLDGNLLQLTFFAQAVLIDPLGVTGTPNPLFGLTRALAVTVGSCL